MRVSEFYLKSCKDMMFYHSLEDNAFGKVTNAAIQMLCQELSKGTVATDILSVVEEYLSSSVVEEWFSFSWQKEREVNDLIAKFNRFLNWLGKVDVIDHDVEVSIPFRTNVLQSKVNLIVRFPNGNFGAINIFKGMSKKSMAGRTLHTSMKTDLYALVSKKVLESRYPNIVVSNVYLTHENDEVGNILPEFEISGKRTSNVYSLNFKEYYDKEGAFLHQKMLDQVLEVVKTPMQPNCYGCKHERLCHTKTAVSLCAVEEEGEHNNYQLPVFSITQQDVVEHKEGPCLVLAGPGSGKTATLTGRIHSLIQSGIEPDYILAITFTRDAANEIKERVSSFTEELPYISTIHALCYDILKKNVSRVGMEVKLLGNKERLKLIEDMAEAFEPLAGFQYNVIDGNQGLLKTLERKLDKYLLNFHKDAEAFLKEEAELGYDFIQFAHYYENLCSAKGYISFTQQISLCVELLKSHPEVLDAYSSIFKYIMVDEFQDIDAMQAEFIYLLANHENLLVVGDDDQSIYGFRGGTNKYMLEFQQRFPNAKIFKLKENFRSTTSLVDAAQAVITSNTERITKEICSGRKESGVAPILIKEKGTEKIDALLQEALKKGYQPKDIAILSVKNNTLEELEKTLTTSCILEKQCLIHDSFFGLLQDCMSLYDSKMLNNTYSFCHYLKLFGVDNETMKQVLCTTYDEVINFNSLKSSNEPFYSAMSLLHNAFQMLEEHFHSPAFFVQCFAYSSKMENVLSLPVILTMIEEQGINTTEELCHLLRDMVRFGDETRLDVSAVNAVHLITNHESKGREFGVVLLIDDFKAELTEEQRRLYYVAMTRAKDILYICYDSTKPSITEKIMEGINYD